MKNGCKYEFIVPESASIRDSARALIGLLNEQLGPEHAGNIRIYETSQEIIVGFLIYHFDMAKLSAKNVVLAERIKPNVNDDIIGCIAAPSRSVQGDMMMDEAHLLRARRSFEQLKKNAELLKARD
jgi:hypothetical protein